jgi:hypothetical protein
MVHEAVKTDMKGTRGFIVDKDSAAPLLPDVVYFGIERNHSEMCKFDSKNSPGLVRPFQLYTSSPVDFNIYLRTCRKRNTDSRL